MIKKEEVIDYEEDKVKQWRGNAATGLWCLSGKT